MIEPEDSQKYSLQDLKYLMQRLRDPETGCPWDVKQNYKSIVPSTIEEVYEVVDAIESGDYAQLREELGDLLFQIIFYCQLAFEEKYFSFDDIVDSLTAKLVRRHPHVFPGGHLRSVRDSHDSEQEEQVKVNWEKIKQEEREAKGLQGILDDVPLSLTALNRAAKLQKRASKVGFDWPEMSGALSKLEEEIIELKQAIASKNISNIEDELGDVLFSSVNLSRHLCIDAEQSLRLSNKKFEERIRWIENRIATANTDWQDYSEEALDDLWKQAKQAKNIPITTV